jgi:hypothetical protein
MANCVSSNVIVKPSGQFHFMGDSRKCGRKGHVAENAGPDANAISGRTLVLSECIRIGIENIPLAVKRLSVEIIGGKRFDDGILPFRPAVQVNLPAPLAAEGEEIRLQSGVGSQVFPANGASLRAYHRNSR